MHRPRPQTLSVHPHRHHRHRTLPIAKFGALVGRVEEITNHPRLSGREDDRHIYLWLRLDRGPLAGRYECAVNIRSSLHSAVEQCIHEEEISDTQIPEQGFWQTQLSYGGIGLRQRDFTPIESEKLAALIRVNAEGCHVACAYGVTYSNWHGIHDIHQNWGEPPDSPYAAAQTPDGDGALVFYFVPEVGAPFRRWLFLKFSQQHLPDEERAGEGTAANPAS